MVFAATKLPAKVPIPWYNPAFPQSSVSMAFPPPIMTTMPNPIAPPLMSMAQSSIPTTVLLATSYPPQVYITLLSIAPVAPVVPVQDVQFDELKAAMDTQATLIAALIAHKDKE